MENLIEITIDNQPVKVDPSENIVEACARVGVKIPTLCYLKGISKNASCGVCVVEVEGAKSLVRSCVQNPTPGMKIRTSTPRVLRARKTAIELLLANHPSDCLSCIRADNCELRTVANLLEVRADRFPAYKKYPVPDTTSEGIVRDDKKCILCGRCVAVCEETQGINAIAFTGRGARTRVATFMDRGLAQSACVQCGQCSVVCPTGAITEKDDSRDVFSALQDPKLHVVVQTAPAIRASLGEALGLPPGSLVTGQMVAALRRLGFAKVFDTQFAADLTIMEEGSELLERLSRGGTTPMITSCSPGWINFIEGFYPDLLGHVSTCKSPQQMFGAVAKTYYAQTAGIAPDKMRVVSIMPCTAKKYEARRKEMDSAWDWWRQKDSKLAGARPFFDVDWALTTRELARMIKLAGIEIGRLPEEDFDDPLGRSTGAATIFGTTGGVMEAALRTVYEIVEKKPLENIEFAQVRGFASIKSAEVVLGGSPVRVAVAHGLSNARILLDEIRAGKSPYQFIEIMSCPGGCVGGGGQPVLSSVEKKLARSQALYTEDHVLPIRKSHENPAIQTLYKEFLGEPLGHLSHELLHTSYKARAF